MKRKVNIPKSRRRWEEALWDFPVCASWDTHQWKIPMGWIAVKDIEQTPDQRCFKYGPYKWAFVLWPAPARINHQKGFRNNRIIRLSWNQFYIWNAKLRRSKAVWVSLLIPRSAVLIQLIKDRICSKSKIHCSLSACLWRHLCHGSIPMSWRAEAFGSSPCLEKRDPEAGNTAGWRRNLELFIHGSSGWKLLQSV